MNESAFDLKEYDTSKGPNGILVSQKKQETLPTLNGIELSNSNLGSNGLYILHQNDSLTPTPSEKQIDLTRFKDSLYPPTEDVNKNAENGIDSPSIVIAEEVTKPEIKDDSTTQLTPIVETTNKNLKKSSEKTLDYLTKEEKKLVTDDKKRAKKGVSFTTIMDESEAKRLDEFWEKKNNSTTAQQEDNLANGQLPKATYDDLVRVINTSNENRFGNQQQQENNVISRQLPENNIPQPNPIEVTQKIQKLGNNSIAPNGQLQEATNEQLQKVIKTINENRFGNQQPQEATREQLQKVIKTIYENSTDEQLRSIIKASNGIRFGNEQQTVEKNTGSVNPITETQPKTPNVGPKSSEVIQPSEGKGTAESITAKLNKYRDDLFNGRELTEEEVNILREDYLSRIPGYNERKKEYMDKLYPEADMQFLLLNRDFKKEIEEFNKSLKNSEGKYVFNKDTKDAARIFLLLYQKEEERLNLAKTVGQPEEEKVKDLSDQKKQRDYKKLALVAGLVTGVSAGLLGGAAVASAIPVVAIGALGSAVVEKIGNSRMKKLQEKIKNETDQVKKDKLLKRMNNWSKVVKFAGIAKSFLGGAATGLALSTFISAKFMGGEGLIDKFSAAQNPQISPNTDRITSHIEERTNTHTTDAISNKSNSWVQQSNTARANTSALQSNSIGASTSNGNGVIVQNGRVNLPDSAWNSNLGGAPTVDLPGGEGNFSSYPGGIENMAAYQAEKDLVAAGLSRNQVLDSLGTRGVHSLLNSYQTQIASGTTNPELVNTLKGLAQYDSKYQSLIDIIAK